MEIGKDQNRAFLRIWEDDWDLFIYCWWQVCHFYGPENAFFCVLFWYSLMFWTLKLVDLIKLTPKRDFLIFICLYCYRYHWDNHDLHFFYQSQSFFRLLTIDILIFFIAQFVNCSCWNEWLISWYHYHNIMLRICWSQPGSKVYKMNECMNMSCDLWRLIFFIFSQHTKITSLPKCQPYGLITLHIIAIDLQTSCTSSLHRFSCTGDHITICHTGLLIEWFLCRTIRILGYALVAQR